jgi:hypothetical protein
MTVAVKWLWLLVAGNGFLHAEALQHLLDNGGTLALFRLCYPVP